MSHITIDSQLQAQFENISQAAIVYDSNGKRLGIFTPAAPASLYEGVDSPVSDDELDSRRKNPARISHEDVMRQMRELL